MRCALIVVPVLFLAACGQIGAGMRQGAKSVNELRTSANVAYNELKYYKQQPDADPQPKRRYCYRFISDIVCYDTEQQDMTAQLVGMQQGTPGRITAGEDSAASNGYTNGFTISTAAAPVDAVQVNPGFESQRPLASPDSIDSTNLPAPQTTQDGGCTPNSPFPCKQSDFVPNADVGK